MSAVQELRRSKQDGFTKKNGVKLGLMSFFIKACVEALKAVPVVNGHIEDDDFIQNNFYDIGVAVGTERGLVVPVVRDADKKSFAGLERNIADYATRARDGKLKIEDLQGGTFTITNGGVYGSLFDSKSATEWHPGHAQDHGATSRRGRQSGSAPDDVSCP
jgi:2-oxoglutarate dehydrogenase E2 component (dihydrolipoamide succinyltransferase)